MKERVVVVGLGYVGLPVAVALGRNGTCLGFDIDETRISELTRGHDRTGEVTEHALRETNVQYTSNLEELRGSTAFIVTVPTPIDHNRQPNLDPLIAATKAVGKVLEPGALVVYESTVYPGLTEEVCGPLLEQTSGLNRSDFGLGYSPERINPGDKRHRLETIVKVVAGEDRETLERVAILYESIVEAGVHRAPSIAVAEAAKVIENTQRDVNIALMNELALIFDRLGIRTADVLAAAGTKWNFLPFTPGLVGGHCIGVDPYYLTARAEAVGYHPEVILSGRRINDGMGAFVAQKLVKMLIAAEVPVKRARVGVLGLTFKENVPDLRNSRVPDILAELREFGIDAFVHDPLANPDEALAEYRIELSEPRSWGEIDALILAVPHATYLDDTQGLLSPLRRGGVVIDVKSAIQPPPEHDYWSL